DIFTLEAREGKSLKKLKDQEGYGSTSVRNLFAAITERRTISLERFLYALGMRHVGETTAKLLARHFRTIQAVGTAATGEEAVARLSAVEGIGEIVAQAIADYFAEPHNVTLVDDLLREVTVEETAAPVVPAGGAKLSGQTIVFTGELETTTR